MRPNLVLIAPNPEIQNVANQVIKDSGFNCKVVVGNVVNRGVKLALEAERSGAEAIISRGGTFLQIQKAVTNLPLIPIEVSTVDLLEALQEASYLSYKIGVVGYPNTIYEAASIGKYLNLEIVEFPIQDHKVLEDQLQREMDKGLEVIVGDTVSFDIAKGLGLQGIRIASGKRAIYEALDKAEQIAVHRRKEVLARHKIHTILNSITEGILVTNNNLEITLCNPTCSKYLGQNSDVLIGERLQAVMPQLNINDEFVNLSGQQYLVNTQKVQYQGDEDGYIITLRPLKLIQDMETKVRKKLYNRGLVAKNTFADIIGESQLLKGAIDKARKTSKSSATVIITGKTGTGKEMFAQGIHNASPRANGPFVAVNCASFPESLLESELFGYVEGSFTDARKGGKPGLFELAHQGTIFLDEIGDMSLSVQAKVLRVLQEKEVIRLGDDKIIPVDIRVIAATHVDLSEAVKQGKFREDLYYRVNVLKVAIPSLAERQQDICLLAEHFLHRLDPSFKIEPGAFNPLLNYDWPGNVRELFNFIEQLVVLSENPLIRKENVQALLPETIGADRCFSHIANYSRRLSDEDILATLEQCGGNQTLACERLGINRSTLWRRLQKLGKAEKQIGAKG